MEGIAVTMEGELNCLGDIFTNEEADLMAQLLGLSSGYGVLSNGDNNFNLHNLSSNYSVSSSQESYYLTSESSNPGSGDTNKSFSFNFSMEDHTNTSMYLLESNGYPNGEMTKGGNVEEFVKTEMDQNSKKRLSGADNVSKVENTKRNVRPKKNPKVSGSSSSSNNEEECNGRPNGPGPGASSSCCSEDDSNVSLNSNGKARASRGAATDPQSLYARKRRERINERLRILQNLVPNGTKVDISTMLEEAAHYVKFLQLQIKLLSSDDLWMYAPLAYNGMDIGLDLKLIAAS